MRASPLSPRASHARRSRGSWCTSTGRASAQAALSKLLGAGFNSPRSPHSKLCKNYRALEALLYDTGVDMVFAGHVHDMERSWPVYTNSSRTPTGEPHLPRRTSGGQQHAGLLPASINLSI